MIVRAASTADVAAIAELEAQSFAADPWPAGYLAEGVAGLLHGTVLHVAVDEQVVGYAITSIVYEVAELQRIAVTPEARRRGIAGQLLQAVRQRATRQGADRLLLEVRESNTAALALYRRAGFVEIDRRARYYRDGATAIVLALDLTQNETHG